ncbi:hypothetical protein RRG08_032187 [Elysia crispata]|uniref:Uncharacterized protein n=1 Tax=Elysia crispata TaxID=231223 RepID=A0AAE1ABB7_9GAST|nr:hypothetical protein RRG08_032187 [Elysia crispata]
MIGPHIEKRTTNFRKPLPATERLVITLRYLASEDTHQSQSFHFRAGISTVRITDASGKFVVVDVGSCGGNSDGGVLSRSSLDKKLMSDKLSIPQRGYIPAPVPNEHLLPRRLTYQNLQKHRQRSTKCGMQVREKLVNYFMTEGAVPWQSNIL